MPQFEQKGFRIWLTTLGQIILLLLSFYMSYVFSGLSMDPIGFRFLESLFVYVLGLTVMIALSPFLPRIVTTIVFMSGTISLLLLFIFLLLRVIHHELNTIQIHIIAGLGLATGLLFGGLRRSLERQKRNRAIWISIAMVSFSVAIFELLPKPIPS